MKARYRRFWWVPLAAIALVGYVAGCGVLPSPYFEHDHGDDDDHDQDQEHDGDDPPEVDPLDPEDMEDASRSAQATDPAAAADAIERLAQFFLSEDEALAAQAGEVLADTARTAEQPMVRATAIGALSLRANDYVEVLVEATRDGDEAVRNAGMMGLARTTPGSAGEARLIELTRDPDDTVKGQAVQALTALRQGAGVDEIVALTTQLGDPDGDASAQAAIALKIKGAEALPELDRVIRESQNPRQRHAAAMCVGLICAGTNPYQERFAETVKAMSRMDIERQPANLAGLPTLIHAMSDPDPMVREIAAQGLGYLGNPRVARPLGKALSDPDTHVRRRAAAALITSPATPVRLELTNAALRDSDIMVRRFAVEALGWIDDPAVAGSLVRASTDVSPEVRREAARQLGRFDVPVALEALVGLFKDPDEDVRWAAVQSVADKRDREAALHLVAALQDPVPQVANAAEAGLQKLGIAHRRMPGVD